MKDFYTITNHNDLGEGKHEFKLELNADHPVYEGHFPEMAVAPGVMLTDLVGSLTGHCVNKQLELVSARNIKFMVPVLPKKENRMHVTLTLKEDDGVYSAKTVATHEELTFFKISASFK